MKNAVVFLGDGFEESEGIVTIDLLRRAEINVITASVMGRKDVLSQEKITVMADALIEDVDFAEADIVILPGGWDGMMNLKANETVKQQCLAFAKEKYVAAICAAPIVLDSLGILEGKQITCYPSCGEMIENAGCITDSQTEVDGRVITGQAPGAAMAFGLKIIEVLLGKEKAEEVAAGFVYKKEL